MDGPNAHKSQWKDSQSSCQLQWTVCMALFPTACVSHGLLKKDVVSTHCSVPFLVQPTESQKE